MSNSRDETIRRSTSWDGPAFEYWDAPEHFESRIDTDPEAVMLHTNDARLADEDTENSAASDRWRAAAQASPASHEQLLYELTAPFDATQNEVEAIPQSRPAWSSRTENLYGSNTTREPNQIETPLLDIAQTGSNEQLIARQGQVLDHDDGWIDVAEERPPPQAPYDPGLSTYHAEPQTLVATEEIPDPFATPDREQRRESQMDDGIPDPFYSPVKELHDAHSEQPPAVESLPPPPLVHELVTPTSEEPSTDTLVHTEDPSAQHGHPEERSASREHISGYGFARLLRRLRKNMNDILEKRVKWQNEQQNLERLRMFHKSSIRGMIATIEAEHGIGEDQDSQNEEAKEKRSRGRRRTHGEIGASQTLGLQNSSGSGRDSVEATTGSMQGPAESMTSITFSNFGEAKEQVRKDEAAVIQQEYSVKALVEQINNLEYHVQELIQEITKQMSTPTFIDELRVDMLKFEETTQDSEQPRPEPEDPTPELVRKLFDWMGERGINLERLQELDHNHNEGLVLRDFLRDQGRDIGVSDEEYLENYRSHREDIETRLDEAKEKITYYQRLCDEAGLDPEQYRKVVPSEYSPDPSHESRSIRVNLQDIAQMQELDLGPKRSISPPREGSKIQVIEGWLDNIAP